MKNVLALLILASFFSGCTSSQKEVNDSTPLKVWFDKPTKKWNRGLPIGNGSLGAMVFGTPQKEKITLNEETIWTGEPISDRDKKDGHKYLGEIRQLLFDGKYVEAEKLTQEKILGKRLPSGSHSYQMLGKFNIISPGLDSVENYRRELDINTAIATTTFSKEGINYQREYFSSFPDQAIVISYAADKAGAVNFSANVSRTDSTKITLSDNVIQFSEHVGKGIGVKFHSEIHFETLGGEIAIQDEKIKVTNADKVIIRIVAASDYRKKDPKQICQQALNNSIKLPYESLKERHIEDYQSLFERVTINLSDSDGEDKPTNVRLDSVKAGLSDNYLTQLQYQFGRYLLISSSRPGTLPANLQGIWVGGLKPPWNSDYHININLQMNYWMAEMANLSECHEPFLEFIGELRENGRKTAKETYGCNGFVAHHTSDVWHFTAGIGKPRYGMWPMGAAWCCQHLYGHYEYTEDEAYLRDYAYPVMKEAAEFFVDFLVENPKTGALVSGPSISPENVFLTKEGERATINMGPTMDRAIVLELFRNCVKASEILNTDDEFREILKNKIVLIPPLQVGSDGRLMEWVEEFEEPEPGHRHISHLFALHPSNQISKNRTPELFEAAKKTIEHRLSNGGGHTGWSRAWIINFYARLLDSNKAHDNILALQQKSTLPNLLDMHPPFQIDGNFGVVSGITEMLMQSHDDEINILPALPKNEWMTGSIKGIVARKGFELDIAWGNGQLTKLVVKSKLGNELKLRYEGLTSTRKTQVGEVVTFDKQLKEI